MEIELYTDGGCNSRTLIGAWAYLILDEDKAMLLKACAAAHPTTNNKMEIEAVLRGLKRIEELELSKAARVTVLSNSQYVVHGYTQWLPNWVANDWQRRTYERSGWAPIANKEQWQALHGRVKGFARVTFK